MTNRGNDLDLGIAQPGCGVLQKVTGQVCVHGPMLDQPDGVVGYRILLKLYFINKNLNIYFTKILKTNRRSRKHYNKLLVL